MFHKILNRTTGRHWTNGVGADIFLELIVTFIRGVPRTLSICSQCSLSLPPEIIRKPDGFFLFFQGVEKGWIGNKWDDETFSENNSIIDGWRPKYVLESIGLCVRREYIFSFTNSCLACCSPRNSSFPWTVVFVCVCVCVCVCVFFCVCKFNM